jgi:hypothetical protein
MILFGVVFSWAYPTYIDVHMTETVTQNVSFAKNFYLVKSVDFCRIVGIINVSNPSTETISDIYLNFSNTDDMKSNFTFVSGRGGYQEGNTTAGARWILHIPELRGGQESVWTYNLSCTDTEPPLNITSAYETTVTGINTKVLAGKNFTITETIKNTITTANITNVNITLETQGVSWNSSVDNFTFANLSSSGDYVNVNLNNNSDRTWNWIINNGTMVANTSYNITYTITAPDSVPTSNTYMAVKQTNVYQVAVLMSGLSLDDVRAVGDIDFSEQKRIIRPATNINDTNVTWQVDGNITVPFNIAYNITRVTIWVTTNLSPLATNTPFGVLRKNYTGIGLVNHTTNWATSGNSWTFNYTDGSDPDNSPPPVVWIRPYYHIFNGGNQIVQSTLTQSGTDLYLQYIYVVNGYWLKVNKNITSTANNQYNITITVSNIGNAPTPSGLTVTVYDFVPNEFNVTSFEDNPNANSTISGEGFNGTSYRWDLGLNPPYNASLGPAGSSSDEWNTSYTVVGSGAYKVSELYIVGLDPRKVEGAGTHEGVTILSTFSSYTKEAFYIIGVAGLILLNIINFVMTRRINQKLDK